MIWKINEFVLFLGTLIVFIGATELSFRFGRRHCGDNDDFAKAHVGALGFVAYGCGLTGRRRLAGSAKKPNTLNYDAWKTWPEDCPRLAVAYDAASIRVEI